MLHLLKRLRLVTIGSNLKYLTKLKYNRPLYEKYRVEKKLWQNLSHASIGQHGEDIPWMDKPVSSEAIRTSPHYNSLPADIQRKVLEWSQNGFMILEGFFQKEQIEDIADSIEKDLPRKSIKKYYSNRLINLYKTNKKVEKVFKDPLLLNILSFLLGKEIIPFQTINFYKSSSQAPHSDSIHLTTEPLGYLIGGWAALEDIPPGSGEFIYYPGSHKLPYIMNKDFKSKNNFWNLDSHLHDKYERKVAEVIEENKLEYKTFLPKKGDLIIWHGNLIHGSLPKQDNTLTRKSLVMHYFAKGVLCYHESTEKPAVLDLE